MLKQMGFRLISCKNNLLRHFETVIQKGAILKQWFWNI